MNDVRTALKAIQWERAKGELRAFAALAGSYPSSGKEPTESDTYEKWQKIEDEVKWFINNFEMHGLHE